MIYLVVDAGLNDRKSYKVFGRLEVFVISNVTLRSEGRSW